MAQHIEINVSNGAPCKNGDNPGVYQCNLHRWGPRGIEHSFIQVGEYDPSDFPIGELAQVLLRVAENRPNPYRNKNAVPISRLIGMSVLRLCTHSYASSESSRDVRLVGEVVGSYAFVQDMNHIYPAEYGWSGPRLSVNEVSTHVKVIRPKGEEFITAQHLTSTPQQAQAYPVGYATPSLAHTRMGKDAWVALRPVADQTSFLETLVPYERLMDTIDLSA